MKSSLCVSTRWYFVVNLLRRSQITAMGLVFADCVIDDCLSENSGGLQEWKAAKDQAAAVKEAADLAEEQYKQVSYHNYNGYGHQLTLSYYYRTV